MATGADIAEVRRNVDEQSDDTYSDDYISALVDAGSIASASARIWRQKAAAYADLVNVSEAGSSHQFSDLSKNALAMAASFDVQASGEAVAESGGRVVVRSIVRP